MKLILVRHAEVEANVKKIALGDEESKLTVKGFGQIRELAKKLKEKYKIDMVFCSPIGRCVETLEGILVEYPIEGPIFMSNLIKERSLGEYANMEIDMIDWDEVDKDSKINREMGVESLVDLRKRINLFLEDLKLEDNNLTVLVITHIGPIRMINDILTGEKFENDKKFDNCSITEFVYDTEMEN